MYKHVFIDLDDTIWDFHSNAKSSLSEIYALKKLGRYFDNFEHYFGLYAKRNRELWDLYGKGTITKDYLSLERFDFPLAQVGVNDQKFALQIGKDYLDLLPTRTALVPFAKELLDYLFPKYPLTIVSNGFVEVQYKKMSAANIEHYFSHVVLSEAAQALKPDKRIFEYALKLNNATAPETIMIGDSYEADIVGAINAGIDQIYFNPYPSDKHHNRTATHQTTKLEEILNIL